MSDYIIDGAILTDIADAVREKTGTIEPIVPENMAEMLRNVEGDYERGYAAGYAEGRDIWNYVRSIAGAFQNNKFPTGTNFVLNIPNLSMAANVTSTGVNVFYACYALHTVNLPSLISINSNLFAYSSLLKRLDFPSVESISGGAFSGCSRLVTLILRKADTVCTLENVSAFSGTSIAKGTGFVYVPDDLVEQYKAATNWSTYANQIKPISELEGTV